MIYLIKFETLNNDNETFYYIGKSDNRGTRVDSHNDRSTTNNGA